MVSSSSTRHLRGEGDYVDLFLHARWPPDRGGQVTERSRHATYGGSTELIQPTGSPLHANLAIPLATDGPRMPVTRLLTPAKEEDFRPSAPSA